MCNVQNPENENQEAKTELFPKTFILAFDLIFSVFESIISTIMLIFFLNAPFSHYIQHIVSWHKPPSSSLVLSRPLDPSFQK